MTPAEVTFLCAAFSALAFGLGRVVGRLDVRRRAASAYRMGFDDGKWRGPAMRRARP